jgi:hypothetical protein
MTEEAAEQVISKLKASQRRLSVLLDSVASDQDWRPDPGEWSFRYIAAHLATVDKNCFKDRVLQAMPGHDQEHLSVARLTRNRPN